MTRSVTLVIPDALLRRLQRIEAESGRTVEPTRIESGHLAGLILAYADRGITASEHPHRVSRIPARSQAWEVRHGRK